MTLHHLSKKSTENLKEWAKTIQPSRTQHPDGPSGSRYSYDDLREILLKSDNRWVNFEERKFFAQLLAHSQFNDLSPALCTQQVIDRLNKNKIIKASEGKVTIDWDFLVIVLISHLREEQ